MARGPLATVCGANARTSTQVSGQPGRARTLPVRCLRTLEEALAAVEQAANGGQAVLYVRNTVDDALEAHAALAARGIKADVFHARFALVDRLQIEKRVVATFGKSGTPEQRAGKVLVATQVVEQSLDLDFDALVSDLAPVDLLIQRAGRLWRHHRPAREGRPELLVVGPEPIADADWFNRAFPRAAYVYVDDPQVTLRLARVRNGRIVPYAPDTESDEPWRAWRLSEVSIAVRRVGGEAVPHAHADAVQAAKAGWTRFDADKILVVLEESEAGDQNLSGVAKSGGEAPTDVRLSYSPQRGLTTDKKER